VETVFNRGDKKEPLAASPPQPVVTATTAPIAKPKAAQKETAPAPQSGVQKQQQPAADINVLRSEQEPAAANKRDIDWKSTLKQFDLQEEATVNAIENRLTFLSENLKLRVSEALDGSYVAIESLNKYKAALKLALDGSDDSAKEVQWRKVTDLFDLQSNHVNEANQRFTAARFILQFSYFK
jgi:hypothetical protein